jgi:hypothetical protein
VHENSGISITGGTVSAGAMAGGDHAIAINDAGSVPAATLEGLRAALGDLTRAVQAGASSLDDPEQAVAVAQMAEREGAKGAPDAGRLRGLLQVLTSGAGAVSGLAGAVSAVEQALQAVR